MSKTVIITFSIGDGSVSDYFIALVNQLSKSYKVIVISDVTHAKISNIDEKTSVYYWPSKRPTKFKDFLFLFKLMQKFRPCLTISIFGSVNICIIVGFLLGIKNRIAWCRTLSSQFPQKKINVLRKKLIYKLSTQLITNSHATKKDLMDVFGVPQEKIQVLHNSVVNYDKNEVINEVKLKKYDVVYVGRLHISKGVSTLIEAISLLKEQNNVVNLAIIGSGPEMLNLKNLVSQYRLEDNIVFLGNQSKPDVLAAFKSAKIAVVPSTSEAFGFTVIEAMSMKTCVIGANNTGIKEIIVDGETGLLFETSNAIDLAVKLQSVLTNEKFRQMLASKGYERFVNHFENTVAVNRDVRFFNQIIQS